ncbi:MAG: maleylacetoacetate isomerase [Deltaproteobacteria bacterium]|nr:maleylacetoacetate isomerase [Deltaproteobacteria bacterium]
MSATNLRLHNYFRSSASFRVRIALALKGIAYEYVPVHLVKNGGEQLAAAHHTKNPMEQVPALELVLDGKPRVIAQSVAIIELLEELYPEPPLYPKDSYLRTRTRELVEIINSGIQPHQNLAPMKRMDQLAQGAGRLHAKHYNEVGLAAYEERVKETAGRFSIGDQVTAADLFLVPQLVAARRFEVDLSKVPTIVAIDERCRALPAFQAAAPDRQPDFEP